MEGGSRAKLGQAGDEQQSTRSIAMSGAAGALTVARDYRRGNWTVPETMVLIDAKRKVHGERHPGEHGLARWRWVEDYCWRAGCRRSHNQCNDRWDNLMRDFKKVRAYETAGSAPSYWAMGRAERKERWLPSNLLREIYDAMGEVIERRMSTGSGCSGGPGGAFVLGAPSTSSLLHVPMQASPLAQVLPRPLPLEQETGHHVGHGASQHFRSESPERKRRRPSLDEPRPGTGSSTPSSAPAPGIHGHHHRQEQGHRRHREGDGGDNGVGGGDDDESSDSECSGDDGGEEEEEEGEEEEGVLSGAIGRCAEILSEALESQEAAEERRHREVMAVEERRGRAWQARREAGEQCVAGLASAVSQLAGSMLALAAAKQKDKGGGGRGPAAPK
ncbi:unnamed protein product [Urochloa decumbens]|uniref:Myb-like domain-containing protein n=1 Tax=Urochloa decumbens TaxID=240449 RepID=A0ABC8X120_9POAL